MLLLRAQNSFGHVAAAMENYDNVRPTCYLHRFFHGRNRGQYRVFVGCQFALHRSSAHLGYHHIQQQKLRLILGSAIAPTHNAL